MKTTARIVRVATALGLMLTLVLLVACAGPSGSANAPDGEQPASGAPATPPTLKLTTPASGATVPAGTVQVAVETTGLTFTMPSNTNVPGEGHVHFTLDDRPFIMSTDPDAEIKDVGPGTHTLKAELVQNDTKSFDPPITQTIEFVAE